MKILEINSVCGIRSTGRICTDIADMLEENGDVCRIGYGRSEAPSRYRQIAVPIGKKGTVLRHALGSRLFDNAGFYSITATWKFLEWVDQYQPDLVHLHNLHGYYINVELLFRYLKEKKLPVVWTLHDCWAFTGHCSHFAAQGCEKWQSGCHTCPQRKAYPASLLVDNSAGNYLRKKALFTGLDRMQIVTPSDWLSDCVGKSFLGKYPVTTVYNGVDLSVFRPTESDFVQQHGLHGKKIVLGVASTWSERKGLDGFRKLSRLLGEDYQVVLVGLTSRQIAQMPDSILGIERTDSIQDLAALYTAAYVHVSMSQEETMGLTVIEANACGTPVTVFNRTALPEIVTPDTGAVLTECTAEAVAKVLMETDFSGHTEACITHAHRFEKKTMYSRYSDIYRSMML